MLRLSEHWALRLRLVSEGMRWSHASRMSTEWLAHRDDLIDEARRAGFDDAESIAHAQSRLGDFAAICSAVRVHPVCAATRRQRSRRRELMRWSSASMAGLLATLSLFGGMTHAIGL